MTIAPPNYTQIPNIFFDYWMPLLSPPEFKVLLSIARKTFGWHKAKDHISLNQLVKSTGLCLRSVQKSIAILEEKQLISKETTKAENGGFNPNLYCVNVQTVQGGYANDAGGVRHEVVGGGIAPNANTKERLNTKERKYPPPPRKAAVSADALTLAALLKEKILIWYPNHHDSNLTKWAESIDKLIRIDKRSVDEIRRVIEWSQNHYFWKANVLSGFKLRKQFDTLAAKMLSETPTKSSTLTPQEICAQYWDNGKFYCNAECFLNSEGISFTRGMIHDSVKFDFAGWKGNMHKLLARFGIECPAEFQREGT